MSRVLKSGLFDVHLETSPSPEIIGFYNTVVLGTPGRLRYRLTDVAHKMNHMNNCYYLVLKKGSRVLGTVGFVRRKSYHDTEALDSWYVRYFSIKAPFRAEKQARKSQNERSSNRFNNVFKSLAAEYFRNPYLFLDDQKPPDQSLVYAYIEQLNERSQQFADIIGFENCRKFTSAIFSRRRMKTDPHVERINQDEKESVLGLIKDFYRDHVLFTPDYLFYQDHYFTYREQGKVVAGLQANPEQWQLVEMPGSFGRMALQLFTRMPRISAHLDPEAFRFVAVEGVFYQEGYEWTLIPLLESACALQHVHYALIYLDTDSPVLHHYRDLDDSGFISRFFNPPQADIKVRFNGMSEAQKQLYRDRPAYISCFDST